MADAEEHSMMWGGVEANAAERRAARSGSGQLQSELLLTISVVDDGAVLLLYCDIVKRGQMTG